MTLREKLQVKISTKIFLSLLFTSLLLLILASSIFYISEKGALRQQVNNQLQSIASLQGARLDSIIEQNLERLELVASRTQLRINLKNYLDAGGKERQRKIVRILNDAKSSIGSFRGIHIFSLTGKLLASTSETSSVVPIRIEKKLLERAQRQNTADYLTLDKGGKLMVLLAGPLYLENRLLGVIIIETDADNFIDSISTYQGLGKTGEVVVAKKTKNGDALFLFPTRFDPNAGLKRIIPKENVNSPIIKGLSHKRDMIFRGVDYREQHVLEVSKHIGVAGWTVFVKVDETEAFSAISKAKRLITTVTISLIFLSIVFAFIISRSITKPIFYLTNITKKISKDGLQTKIEKCSNDEIGVLADSFSKMIRTRQKIEEEREKLMGELQKALAEVKELRGILPICSHCKKIRNDEGYFEQIEAYIRKRSGVDFSHTICPNCLEKYYPKDFMSIIKKEDPDA